jgi:23S rRNA (cytosine1962-C5)-methyltransferase
VIQADAFEWVNFKPRRRFGLVILDPPSLAKRESERAGAKQAYVRLAAAGLRHLASHGILLAASCSAHVSAEEFFDAVLIAARASGRGFEVLRQTHHAPDHPATFAEAEYLKAIYLQF